MSTLYRKYRPQSFSEVIGQNHIKITLQNELESGQIGHAYLFCGPRGLGKTTCARLFAKSVNCQNRQEGESEPCNKCQSCLEIVGNHSVDVIEIDAASHTGVDNVRENIIESSRFTPASSKYKVFIIDEVHMLSTAAFNALLKTLEEPPAHVIFILCTTEIHKLPATIISRCQRFDFKKITTENMAKRLSDLVKLEEKKVTDDVIKKIVLYAEGCVRDAESLLGKVLTLGDDIDMEQAELVLPRSEIGNVVKLLVYLAEKNSTAGIELINKLVEEGVDLNYFADNLIEYLRKILLIKVNGSLSGFGIELDEESAKAADILARKFSYAEIVAMIELFLAKSRELRNAFIVQFPLELAIVQLVEETVCQKQDEFSGSTTEEVKAKIRSNLQGLAAPLPEKKSPEIVEPAADKPIEEKIKAEIEEKAVIGEKVEAEEMAKSEAPEADCKVDFDKIVANWQVIVDKILGRHFSLSAVLRLSQPLKCVGNALDIGVANSFFKNCMETANNKQIVEEVIQEVSGFSVRVKGVVSEKLAIASPYSDTGPAASTGSGKITIETNAPTAAPVAPPITVLPKGDAVAEVMSMF